jgi:hypothetical protein
VALRRLRPRVGEDGVPFVPSAGRPSGCSTITTSLEPVVPWTTLFVTHAKPRASKARLPGPPKSFSLSSLPESFTFTTTVHASGWPWPSSAGANATERFVIR